MREEWTGRQAARREGREAGAVMIQDLLLHGYRVKVKTTGVNPLRREQISAVWCVMLCPHVPCVCLEGLVRVGKEAAWGRVTTGRTDC